MSILNDIYKSQKCFDLNNKKKNKIIKNQTIVISDTSNQDSVSDFHIQGESFQLIIKNI